MYDCVIEIFPAFIFRAIELDASIKFLIRLINQYHMVLFIIKTSLIFSKFHEIRLKLQTRIADAFGQYLKVFAL